MNGAVTASKMNSNDITNIAVPANPPITFNVDNPLVDKYKNAKKITNEIIATMKIL